MINKEHTSHICLEWMWYSLIARLKVTAWTFVTNICVSLFRVLQSIFSKKFSLKNVCRKPSAARSVRNSKSVGFSVQYVGAYRNVTDLLRLVNNVCLSLIVRTNPPIYNRVRLYRLAFIRSHSNHLHRLFTRIYFFFLLDNNFYHISVIDIQRDDAQRPWII